MTLTILLPWPPPGSSQNGRKHWAVKNKQSETDRGIGRYAVKDALAGADSPFTAGDRFKLFVTYCPPTHNALDLFDNAPASCKGMLDGAFAALGCDDKQVRQVISQYGAVGKPGGVVITIDKL